MLSYLRTCMTLDPPKYLLDSAMCYAKLKIIMQNTSTETCLNKLCKTRNVRAVYKKLRLTFLGMGFNQHHAGQLEEELRALKYKGEYKHSNFQMYTSQHEKIYQQMQSLKTDSYAGINFGIRVRYFLGGIEEPSLETALQICKSQDSYSVDFQACISYLTTMVQKTLTARQVNVAATATKADSIKLKKRDSTYWCNWRKYLPTISWK